METTYFSNWIAENFYPTAIIFSTDKTKMVIAKNNLSPAEFFRPFGIFDNVTFAPTIRNEMNIKNFRLDFEDSESYQRISRSKLQGITDKLLQNKKIKPDWNKNFNIDSIVKNGYQSLLKYLKNYSLPWFNEYEKMYLEFFRFNEYEFYQQPLAYFYTCSIGDELSKIAPSKEKIPHLIYEKIYELNMPVVIIVLVDKTDKSLTNKDIESYLFKVKSEYKKFNVFKMEINTNNPTTNPIKNDIWAKYVHKFDLYSNEISDDYVRGQYISETERLQIKNFLTEIMNKVIINQLCAIVYKIDEEITLKKKGFKNTLFNMFQKNEVKEYNDYFKIINLTDLEKKEYLLSMIYFYFRNYRGAYENIKLFNSDVSPRSPGHYNAGFELKFICDFLLHYDTRDIDYEEPFKNYIDSQQYCQAFRILIIVNKMMEQRRNFTYLPKLIWHFLSQIPCVSKKIGNSVLPHSQIISRVQPLIKEKLSYYYLIQTKKKYRSYITSRLFSCGYYLDEGEIYENYALNCLKCVYPFLNEKNYSFVKEKCEFNKKGGEICKKLNNYEGSIKFYKNYLEMGRYFKESIQQEYMKLLNSLNECIKNNNNEILNELNYLSIPEVDNTSLLIIDERDYLISEDKNVIGNWYWFNQYSIIPLKKIYISLTPNDINSLKNLDNIIGKKQNFTNFSKKSFQSQVNGKIFVRFIIKNPVNMELNITSIKLMCEYINSTPKNSTITPSTTQATGDNSKNTPQNNGEESIEYQKISLKLSYNQQKEIQLYCKPLKEGNLIMKGVEIELDNLIIIEHYFNKKNFSKLYSYRIKKVTSSRRGSCSSGDEASLSSSSIERRNSARSGLSKKHELIFNIIDNSSNIIVDFPMGEEIELYKNQLIFMPIKIKNNSKAKIKRFTLFFKEDDLTGKKKYVNKNENILSDYINKEIDLFDNPNNPNSKLETVVYVPINPKEIGELYIKILVKFEEEVSWKDNEVKRYLIKLNVKNSINISIKNTINKILPVDSSIYLENKKEHNSINKNKLSNNKEEKIFNFSLNVSASIVNKEKFKDVNIGDFIYSEPEYKRENIQPSDDTTKPSSTNTFSINDSEYSKLYKTFTFSKKVLVIKSKMSSFFGNYNYTKDKIKLNDIMKLSQKINFDFIPDYIINDPFQSHIKSKFCQLLLKNNLLFTWNCVDKDSNKIINGLYFYQPALSEPKVECNFLHNLFQNNFKTTTYVKKINEGISVINIKIQIDLVNICELKQIKSFEIYIDDDKELKWFGNKSYFFKNLVEGSHSNNIGVVNFSCFCYKKGKIDVNKITFRIINKERSEPILLHRCPEIEDVYID